MRGRVRIFIPGALLLGGVLGGSATLAAPRPAEAAGAVGAPACWVSPPVVLLGIGGPLGGNPLGNAQFTVSCVGMNPSHVYLVAWAMPTCSAVFGSGTVTIDGIDNPTGNGGTYAPASTPDLAGQMTVNLRFSGCMAGIGKVGVLDTTTFQLSLVTVQLVSVFATPTLPGPGACIALPSVVRIGTGTVFSYNPLGNAQFVVNCSGMTPGQTYTFSWNFPTCANDPGIGIVTIDGVNTITGNNGTFFLNPAPDNSGRLQANIQVGGCTPGLGYITIKNTVTGATKTTSVTLV